MQLIGLLRLVFDDLFVNKIIGFASNDSTKVFLIGSCSNNRTDVLLNFIPQLSEVYRALVDEKRVGVKANGLDLLPCFELIRDMLNLKVCKMRDDRTIKI